MSFYLKPPRGDIALDKLEELTLKRWKFLEVLGENSENISEILTKHSDLSVSVMENSSRDRVSHYFLRLSVSKINDFRLSSKFVNAETRLFEFRLSECSISCLRQSLCEVVRHIDSMETSDEELNILGESIVNILSEDMLEG